MPDIEFNLIVIDFYRTKQSRRLQPEGSWPLNQVLVHWSSIENSVALLQVWIVGLKQKFGQEITLLSTFKVKQIK